jgi:hypothetical protein
MKRFNLITLLLQYYYLPQAALADIWFNKMCDSPAFNKD